MQPKMEPRKLDVLIVGAGPTGLAMAGELARRGLQVRIIDQGARRSEHSKALGVQARTLEMLETQLGWEVVQDAIDRGSPAMAANIHIDGSRIVRVPTDSIQSPYPFVLILAQSETERILEDYLGSLGKRIDRVHQFMGLDQDDEGVTARVLNANGVTESVRARFLIGCDGAHSSVRKSLELPFEGDRYPGEFILADVRVEWPYSYGEIHAFVGAHGAIACFPMQGEKRYRLTLIPHEISSAHDGAEVSLEELRQQVKALSGESFAISDPRWISRFRVHHRMVPRFRSGRVFLAGDAAHIHSPAGGQGMNTGIQDAFNLGWKLDRVIRGKSSMKLLDTYEGERMPVARAVLRETDRVFRSALLRDNPVLKFARRSVVPRLVKSRFVQRAVFSAVSQINLDYRGSPIVLSDAAGKRAPDARFRNGAGKYIRLYPLLRHPGHTLLYFEGSRFDASAEPNARALSDEMGGELKILRISRAAAPHGQAWDPGVFLDPSGEAHARYDCRGGEQILIRPDGYAVLRGSYLDPEAVRRYFACLE